MGTRLYNLALNLGNYSNERVIEELCDEVLMKSGALMPAYRDVSRWPNEIVNFVQDQTKFVKETVKFSKRILLLHRGYRSHSGCETCGSPVHWDHLGFRHHCSKKCSSRDPKVQQKLKDSTMKIHGVDSIFKSERFKKNVAEIWKEKYGVDNPSKSQIIKDKIADKVAPKKKEIQEKIRATNQNRYGADYPLQSKIVQSKISEIFQEKYGGSSPFCDKDVRSKALETVHESYGGKHFSQIHLTDENLNARLKSLDSDFNIDDLGLSRSHTYKILKKMGAVFEPSRSFDEEQLCTFIRSLGYEIKTNDRSLGFELDILIPDRNLAIEYNGLFWHSESKGKDSRYHIRKTEKCLEKGIKLIHIFSDDWLQRRDIVHSRIAHALGATQDKIYARNCFIGNVSHAEAKEFFTKNHIQGAVNSSLNIGLIYEGEIVSVASFGKARYQKTEEYELYRLSSKLGTSIVGGPSRLLTEFERKYRPKFLVSYANRCWGDGDFYQKLGFKFDRYTSPGYRYTRDYHTLFSRIKFQKHKLEKLLEKYDPDMTEWENMQANGYDRIWDCGNVRYVKHYQ